jgi:hypothetical protein
MWWMYFVYVYENRTMKFVEIAIKKERGRMRENEEGGSIYCKHI